MARPRGATVRERKLRDGSTTFWTQLTVGEHNRVPVTLGTTREGMDRTSAGTALERQQHLVALGKWTDPRPRQSADAPVLFGQFGEDWLAAESRKKSPNTQADLRWRLDHLRAFFDPYRVDQIHGILVERYIDFKLAERDEIAERLADGERLVDGRGQPIKPLANKSINMTLVLLERILKKALKRGLIQENAAAGERLKASKFRRTWLTADQVIDLIDAAERIDRTATPAKRERAQRVQEFIRRTGLSARQAAPELGLSWSSAKRLAALDLTGREPSIRRAIIATLALAGLRASECCALRWRDLDFANRVMHVPGTKTDAADRELKIVDFLMAELQRWREHAPVTGPDDLVFPTLRTRTFRPRTKDNIRERVLAPAVREADRVRVKRGLVPLPERTTPHSLRRTFAALMLAHRYPVPEVQHEIGHADSRTTLEIYATVMRTDRRASRELIATLCAYSDHPPHPKPSPGRPQPRRRPLPAPTTATVRFVIAGARTPTAQTMRDIRTPGSSFAGGGR